MRINRFRILHTIEGLPSARPPFHATLKPAYHLAISNAISACPSETISAGCTVGDVLAEGPRPGAGRELTGKVEALLVATARSSPPVGRSRWTLDWSFSSTSTVDKADCSGQNSGLQSAFFGG